MIKQNVAHAVATAKRWSPIFAFLLFKCLPYLHARVETQLLPEAADGYCVRYDACSESHALYSFSVWMLTKPRMR
jgi:hypothetical protein